MCYRMAKSGSDLRLAWRPRHLITPESPGAQHWRLAGVNFDVLLHRFRDRTDLQEIRFFRRFAAERVREAGHLLMAFNQGDPALTVQSVGAGQVDAGQFFASPGGQRSGHPQPVPSRCCTSGCADCAPASRVPTPLRGGRPLSHHGARGRAGQLRHRTNPLRGPSAGGPFDRQEEAAVLLGPVAEAGLYRIFNGAVAVGAVAVNVNNAKAIPAGWLRINWRTGGRDRPIPVHIAGAEETAEQFNRRSGRPVWPVFMLMLLGLLAMENLMMVVWKR